MAEKTMMDKIAWVLVLVGGLNWGLDALGWNLVNFLFGWNAMVEKVVYLLVGVSALYLIIKSFKKD